MTKKVNYEVLTTGVVTLEYPWVTKPDTKFDKPHGTYRANLILPFEEAQETIAQLERILKDYIQALDAPTQAKLTPVDVYEQVLDAETGEPTGDVRIKTKLKAFVETDDGGFTQAPVIVNADDGSAVQEPVYGGTRARVKAQVVPYKNMSGKSVGLSLRLRSVQVHELVTGQGGNWADFS